MKREDVILFSGGAVGAEDAFGACAEQFGIEEVNFSFDGHKPARTRGLRTPGRPAARWDCARLAAVTATSA